MILFQTHVQNYEQLVIRIEMSLFSGILNDLFDGSQKSDCLLPCTTAHFETKFLNKYASDTSYIDMTFSSEVREAYPKPILLLH